MLSVEHVKDRIWILMGVFEAVEVRDIAVLHIVLSGAAC